MIDRHFARLRARDDVSAEEERAVRSIFSDPRDHKARQTIIRAGDVLESSTLLLDGLVCRYKDLRNGERQISAVHVPGDFVDLHSFTLKRLDHNVMTLTACKVVLASHAGLRTITERFPHLTRVYWFSTNLDAALHREWELSLGRRSALARVAALLCEFYHRFQIVGMTDATGYTLRMTQTDIAECTGLTSVHVNRTLKELRERGLVEFRNSRVEIPNLRALAAAGEFDPAYLYLERRDR